ncbi:threonine-phosphate decarboxylase [Microcoleus sp. FACHB-1515]|nr:threonine-phosphate decarboxylase [Microcoleus sp. FACHB-1515]
MRPVHGGNLAWAAQLAQCPPSVILDFSASINPLGPPASALDAIASHLTDLCHYPDPRYTELRRSIAQFHSISPDWILPGNGAAELLTWSCRELATLPQTHRLVPAFGDYGRALDAFGAQTVDWPIPLRDGCAIPERERCAITQNRLIPIPATATGGLLLNNPHNPTGQLFSVAQILPLLDQFALVVIDEAFMDFLPPAEQESLIDRVADFPNLVILRSLTKFYSLPGLRLGYAIAHPDRLKRWQQWRDPWAVNVLAAAVGEVVLQDVEFQQKTWNWLKLARSQLFDGFQQLGLNPFPGAANFLLVECEASVELQRQLLQQHRILIRDCLSFAQLGDRFFRVAVRTEPENQRLIDGLAAIFQHGG